MGLGSMREVQEAPHQVHSHARAGRARLSLLQGTLLRQDTTSGPARGPSLVTRFLCDGACAYTCLVTPRFDRCAHAIAHDAHEPEALGAYSHSASTYEYAWRVITRPAPCTSGQVFATMGKQGRSKASSFSSGLLNPCARCPCARYCQVSPGQRPMRDTGLHPLNP